MLNRVRPLVYLLALPLALVACKPEDEQPRQRTTAPWTLELGSNQGEAMRITTLHPGTTVPMESRLLLENGNTAFMTYRADGTLSAIIEYFGTKQSNDGAGPVRYRALVAANGRSRLQEEYFRQDGSTEQRAQRRADNSYERVFYGQGDIVVRRKIVMGPRVLLEEENTAQGHPITLFEAVDTSISRKTYFRPNGAGGRVSEELLRYGTIFQKTLFADDGQTPLLRAEKRSVDVQVDYFGDGGRVVEKRMFNYDGRMFVTVLREDGTPSFEQTWAPSNSVSMPYWGPHRLHQITVHRPEPGIHRVLYTFDINSGVLREARRFAAAEATSLVSVRTFGEDGSFQKEVTYNGNTPIENLSVDRSFRERIDAVWKAERPFQRPPLWHTDEEIAAMNGPY